MELVKNLLVPLTVALISWFIKDYIFAQQKAKQEFLRAERQRRLTAFWSPLYLWSGLILFPKYGDEKNIDKAVSELIAALAGNAHLLPKKHYFVIVSLIEKVTVLPQKAIDMSVVNDTRAYIYRQIETLNFLLYKREAGFDPFINSTFLGPPFAFLRIVAYTTVHFLVWGLLVLYLNWGYHILIGGHFFLLFPYLLLTILPLWIDAERRLEINREASDYKTTKNKYGILAFLRWCKRKLSS